MLIVSRVNEDAESYSILNDTSIPIFENASGQPPNADNLSGIGHLPLPSTSLVIGGKPSSSPPMSNIVGRENRL